LAAVPIPGAGDSQERDAGRRELDGAGWDRPAAQLGQLVVAAEAQFLPV
jgi:hypothetical protein